ncbi:hypothetical protein V8E36_005626 [Tilletia maclaganii]
MVGANEEQNHDHLHPLTDTHTMSAPVSSPGTPTTAAAAARYHDRTSSSASEELIPLPQIRRSSADRRRRSASDDEEDEDDDEDDLIVHESRGLLADEEDGFGLKDAGGGGGGHGGGGSGRRYEPLQKSLAINRAWQEKNEWMVRHRYYGPLRLSFFALLGIGAITLAVFALRSVLHVSSSHAPGSPSSSSHPPSDPTFLATSLHPNATLTNGTHEWRHTVIYISLDGVKPDYVRHYKLRNVARIGLGDELFDANHDPGEEEEEDEHEGALIPGGIGMNNTGTNGVRPGSSGAQAGGGNGGGADPLPHIQSSPNVGHLLASSMLPIFPTVTFPNHWSLLTGLYASSHGIVANDFHVQPREKRRHRWRSHPPPASHSKPSSSSSSSSSQQQQPSPNANLGTGRQFYYADPARSWFASWWLGQPIWATAERAGIPTAVHMWPGPPVTSAGDRPRYFREYEEGPEWDGRPDHRIRDVLDWLGKGTVSSSAGASVGAVATAGGGADVRPQLICVYFPDVDKAAHAHGPWSAEVDTALLNIDLALGQLRAGIHALNATELVDLIVVSDHGMAETSAPSTERVVFLDKVLGAELWAQIESIDGYPSRGIRFRRPILSGGWLFGLFGGSSEDEVERAERALYERAYDALEAERKRIVRASLGWSGPYRVYWREELPKEWHWNDEGRMDGRLAPLWVVPTEGWGFTNEEEMKHNGGVFRPKG